MLVVDASIAVNLALHDSRPATLSGEELIAPPLLWSEATSALHEMAFRGDILPDAALAAISHLHELGIARHDPPRLYAEAARIARRLGWAKTYDAEYVATALLTGSRLLTRDLRLRRGADRVVTVLGPLEL